MIPSSAIDAYLNRELDNHLWIKKLSLAELNTAIDQLDPKPHLHPKLRKHQRACFLLGVSYPQFCYWNDMGTGKSVLVLELLKYWWKIGKLRRAIIFVTSDKAFRSWTNQFKTFGIDLPYTTLQGSSEQKWQQLEEFGDGVVILPYPGAVAMVCQRVKNKKGKVQFKLDPKLVNKLAAWAQGFVLDESTKAASLNSVTGKLIRKLMKKAFVRYALAGRPLGRDPTMLWNQYFLIDGGETLGQTVGLFRAAFFTEKPCYWDPKGYAKEYTFKQKMRPQLSALMQHRSITYSAEECLDLPKFIPIPEYVSFGEEAQAYYDRAVKDVIAAKGNLRQLENAFLRMRQCSSGFMGLKDDETGDRVEIEFAQNPKLDRLLELVEELPEGRKAVVFYAFTYSGRKIVERLKELGIKPIWLWSGTKNPTKEQDRFINDPSVTVAVVNLQLGSMSLDGMQQVANFTFFYESPPSPIDREQAERRLYRDGQKRTVFNYDILVEGTVDVRMREFHAEGQSIFDALLKTPAKVLDGSL